MQSSLNVESWMTLLKSAEETETGMLKSEQAEQQLKSAEHMLKQAEQDKN